MLEPVLLAVRLSLPEAGLMALLMFLSGIVRGFTGFGSSALVVTSMGLITPARELVPMMNLLEILASLHLLPRVWRQIDWSVIGWIVLLGFLTVPLGQWVLLVLTVAPMRLLVSVLVLSAALLLWRQREPWMAPNARTWMATGAVAGLMNGLAAVGGMGAMLMFLGTRIPALQIRATLIGLLFIMGIYAGSVALANGLMNSVIAARVGLMIGPLVLGVMLGSHCFTRSQPASFRHLTLLLMIILALCGIVHSLL